MSMFHVGQRVVCVSTPPYRRPNCIPFIPIESCVYTVRDIGMFNFDGDVELAIWLEELINPTIAWENWHVSEHGFWIGRFRPVKDTSIEIFRSLLSPIPEEVG